MPIIIKDVSDEELLRACEVEASAFTTSPLSHVLFPGLPKSETEEEKVVPPNALQERADKFIEMRKEDHTIVYLQAYDEEEKKMVGFAKWSIFKTPEEAESFKRPMVFGPGANAEACTMYFKAMEDRKKAIMEGKAYLYLHILVTDPAFQGRGAGSMLTKWGLDKAQELGLSAYLESSAIGHKLYSKLGFKDVETLDVDFTRFGGPVHHQPLMLFEPKK